jgi:thioredoxin-like negative regulator of GroEL
MLAKVLEDVVVKTPIINIDIDSDNVMAVKYGIRGVPMCVLINDDGTEVRRKAGVMTEEEFKQFVGE